METLLQQIKACDVCQDKLPHPPRPVMAASPQSKIIIIGQAPGSKVHASGVPWDDPSGDLLRAWLGIKKPDFYNPKKIGIIPMGFCYPGKGKSGDLPPRPECAPLWHPQLFEQTSAVRLTLLIGQYAQRYYLGETAKKNLTETVRNFETYLPQHFPLPHPSPRNRFWMRKNPWFQSEVLPELKSVATDTLGG
ncbi:MAG: uracil-DNA glycosylase family protein [Chloroflexota bacterium]